MNNVALRADVVTGLYRRSGAASQQTGILGEDTARRMRVRGIPLARQPEDSAGLQVDASDAISADRQAQLLNVDRRDTADVRKDLACGERRGRRRMPRRAGHPRGRRPVRAAISRSRLRPQCDIAISRAAGPAVAAGRTARHSSTRPVDQRHR